MAYFEDLDIFDEIHSSRQMAYAKPAGVKIDYENPKEVAELMAWHLAKIFWVTFKGKVEQEVEKLKAERMIP